MVMTIAPRSVGSSRHETLNRTLVPFAIGAVAAGALVFGAAGVVGQVMAGLSVVTAALLLGIGAIASLYGVTYVAGRSLPVPHTLRQVPKLWREVFSPMTAAALYGAGLGVGFFTRVPFVTFYLAIALAALSASPLRAAGAGAVFGLARSLPLVFYRVQGVELGEADDLVARILRHSRLIQVTNGLVLMGLAAILATSLPR
jgi:hypothetical protein